MKRKRDLIVVTKKDVCETVKGQLSTGCKSCAIARAMRRAGYKDFSVDLTSLAVGEKLYALPSTMTRWQIDLTKAENGIKRKPKPFRFRISDLEFDGLKVE